MVSNALAASAVGLELGLSLEQIAAALSTFPGVARRSEVVGRADGVTVIDDYGHHPTEIASTLRALRRAYATEGRLIVLFQPHRYTRTRDLFAEFCHCFGDADVVILTEIYGAGEEVIPGVTGERLATAVNHREGEFVSDLEQAGERCLQRAEPGDVVVTLGAGSVGGLAARLVKQLRERECAQAVAKGGGEEREDAPLRV
jgi:UDP-N-acetylmuramate--alanine ligase